MRGTWWLAVLLLGCAGSGGQAVLAPTKMTIPPAPQPAPGSLYRGAEWFTDHRARQVGDVITVQIVESAEASSEASTETGRESSLKASLDKFLGLSKEYPSSHPFLNPFKGISASTSSDFKGSGTTTRKSKLSTTISAMVVEVLPNGNLVIEGSRRIMVNGEDQSIVLRGIVRPEDVSEENVVLSTAICNAQISYTGRGVVAEQQRPGWFARLFFYIWPF